MKTIWLFILVFTSCLTGFSQPEFAPIGAEWYYSFNEGMENSGSGYYLLKSIKDTVIDSKECKVLSHTLVNSKRISTHLGQSIVYQDKKENKVYMYVYANFYLLYDFTKVVGDTIVIKMPHSASSYDSIVTVVDSVGTVTFPGNIQLKSFFVRPVQWGSLYFDGKIIEKIGNLHFLYPLNDLYCDGGCPDPLRCYNDDKISFNLYQLPCDAVYTNTNTNIVNTFEVSVYPNPVMNGTVYFENLDFETLELFDSNGKLLRFETVKGIDCFELNVLSLPSGAYYYSLKTKGLVPTKGKIIVQ